MLDNKENKEPSIHPYFFVVSNAGSQEVNGVYKNLDENSNDGTLNYKMINSDGKTFKLYRTPSEDRSLRYWILEERNKEYYYMVVDAGDIPPEMGWMPYIAGQPTAPEVTRIPREVELELRTRIELKDSLTTLDLTTEYGEYCPIEALKRLYRVLWEEQSPEAQEATRLAMAKEKAKVKKKKQKVKPKITVMVNLGGNVPDESESFELTVAFDAIVWFLKKVIAKRLELWSGSRIELMLNGSRILSNRACINKLGIIKGSSVYVLVRNRDGQGLSQISLPCINTPEASGSPCSPVDLREDGSERRNVNDCCVLS